MKSLVRHLCLVNLNLFNLWSCDNHISFTYKWRVLAYLSGLVLLSGPRILRFLIRMFWKMFPQRSVAQSCPTLCDPMDCSPPGSSVLGILQARLLEGVSTSGCRGSSRPRDRTHVSCVSVLYHYRHQGSPQKMLVTSEYLVAPVLWQGANSESALCTADDARVFLFLTPSGVWRVSQQPQGLIQLWLHPRVLCQTGFISFLNWLWIA